MTAAQHNRPSLFANPVAIALAISLGVHGGGFGLWKLGNAMGWWKPNAFSAWVQNIGSKLLPTPKLEAKQPNPPPNQPTLTFVEVNPAEPTEAPKDAKFYGAVSTKAASPKESEDDIPKIEGTQPEVLKVTEDKQPKALPLQPSPKVAPPEPTETEAKPQEQKVVGDLAFAKPHDKPQDEKGEAEKKGEAKETRRRPRTLAEAMKKSGTLGQKAKMDGGSKRLDLSSSLDVKGTALGDYVAELVEAVKERWYAQLDQVSATTPGKVVIEFRLHSSGRVSNVKVGQTEVGELLSLICQKAIQDPSPYRPWPKELRNEMNAEYRDVSFTFYYLRN